MDQQAGMAGLSALTHRSPNRHAAPGRSAHKHLGGVPRSTAPPSIADQRLWLPCEPWTVPRARQFLRNLVRPRRIDPDRGTALDIALTEACSNTVRHAASGGTYEVGVRIEHTSCVVEVLDHGDGFDAPAVMARPPTHAESGRGLWLITRLVDSLEIRRRHPTGTLLRFALQLAA